MAEFGRHLWRAPGPTPPAQAGIPTANFSGPCPDNFQVSSMMETPQLSVQPLQVLGHSQGDKIFLDVQMLK